MYTYIHTVNNSNATQLQPAQADRDLPSPMDLGESSGTKTHFPPSTLGSLKQQGLTMQLRHGASAMRWDLMDNWGAGALGNGLPGKSAGTGPFPQLVTHLWIQGNLWDQTEFYLLKVWAHFSKLGRAWKWRDSRRNAQFQTLRSYFIRDFPSSLPAKTALPPLNEALHEQPQSPVLALLLIQDAKWKQAENQVFCLNAAQQSSRLSCSTFQGISWGQIKYSE